MHPRIQELFQHLAHCRADLKTAVDHVPAGQRDTRPAPDRWSVAEVLEHLAIIETRVAQRLEGLLAEATAKGLGKEVDESSVLHTVDMPTLLDRTRRINAPSVVQPTGTMNSHDAWAELERARARLHAVILTGDGLALGTLSMMHPVLGELTFYQWIGTVAGHEARHTAQIREMATA